MGMGLTLMLLLGAAQPTPQADSGEAGVRAALGHYLRGQATGDPQHYLLAFHPDGRLAGVRDGKHEQRSLAEYLALQSGRPAADEAQRKRSITYVSVTGDAAVATIELDYPRAFTTDHMSLIRVGNEWRIIYKLYNVRSKPRP